QRHSLAGDRRRRQRCQPSRRPAVLREPEFVQEMACREGAEKEWSSADGGLILAASTGCGSSSSRKFAMPLLDHFHPPLHGPRRWEGFHHAWATFIAQQLNEGVLPSDYFAESEISLGPELEIDVASLELARPGDAGPQSGTAVWSPPRPKIAVKVD